MLRLPARQNLSHSSVDQAIIEHVRSRSTTTPLRRRAHKEAFWRGSKQKADAHELPIMEAPENFSTGRQDPRPRERVRSRTAVTHLVPPDRPPELRRVAHDGQGVQRVHQSNQGQLEKRQRIHTGKQGRGGQLVAKTREQGSCKGRRLQWLQ